MPGNLKKISLIGSTGLIGTHFLEQITQDDFQNVKAITRRNIPNLEKKDFMKQSVHDFSDLEKMRQDLKTDVLVNALGTTIKKAGSKDEFIKIDHDLPLKISRISKEEGSPSSDEQIGVRYYRVGGSSLLRFGPCAIELKCRLQSRFDLSGLAS